LVHASLGRVERLTVAFLELVEELIHLAELAEDELRAEGDLVFAFKREATERDRCVPEGFSTAALLVESTVLMEVRPLEVSLKSLGEGWEDGGA
jgi:hypothetical protein